MFVENLMPDTDSFKYKISFHFLICICRTLPNPSRLLDQLGRLRSEVKTDSFRIRTNGIESRLNFPYESAHTVIYV